MLSHIDKKAYSPPRFEITQNKAVIFLVSHYSKGLNCLNVNTMGFALFSWYPAKQQGQTLG